MKQTGYSHKDLNDVSHKPFIVIRLDGAVHKDEKISFAEIVKQLYNEATNMKYSRVIIMSTYGV